MNQERLRRVREEILANGFDGIALMPGPNMQYLSGIRSHISERPVVLFVPADDDPAIIIPSLEAAKALQAGIPKDRIFDWSDEEGYTGAFHGACAHLELSDYLLGVESLHMRLLELELLQRYAPGLTLAHAEPVMTALRITKDISELGAMQKAVAVAEKAMEALLPRIEIGMTEKTIAVMLLEELVKAGGEGIPFGPIVSTGPNASSPHAVPTDRAIQEGDMLVIDWGAVVDGYPSDITRTFAVGDIEPEFARIYHSVKTANAKAKNTAGPGAACSDVDKAARESIEQDGYGPYFIHRTGHGLGLEVHEPPYIVEGNEELLVEGAVFTVEPGIYIRDRVGVRIEDDVVITPDGCRSITTFPRELISIG